MAQYNSLNVRLSNSQVNKLESAIKNKAEVIVRLLWNMIGNSDEKINFSRKLLWTKKQVANLRQAFKNNSSTDNKLSKTLLSKMIQLGAFLGRIHGRLLKTGLSLMKNVIRPLAKSVLIPLGSTAAASPADVGIHKNILEFGTIRPIISND